MALAGLLAAQHITGRRLPEERILFVGAGGANIGIGARVIAAMMKAGLGEGEARQRCWFADSRGLVVSSRTDLTEHKRPYAQSVPFLSDLREMLEALCPTTLIGATGQGALFTRPVLEAMARYNERPVIYALSNPTRNAECTAEEAYRYTDGRAVFATGSPFAPVSVMGRPRATGQANNAFIFPGVGLGVIACGARHVTEDMFVAAAEALAAQVSADDLTAGRIFPSSARLREVAAAVARSVAEVAYAHGLATRPRAARPPRVHRDSTLRTGLCAGLERRGPRMRAGVVSDTLRSMQGVHAGSP